MAEADAIPAGYVSHEEHMAKLLANPRKAALLRDAQQWLDDKMIAKRRADREQGTADIRSYVLDRFAPVYKGLADC